MQSNFGEFGMLTARRITVDIEISEQMKVNAVLGFLISII
jgi:hypothetical protein